LSLLFFRAKDYNTKKDKSALEFHKTLTKVTQSTKKVPWTFAARDNYLRNGYQVLITNKKLQGYMVADLSTKAHGVDEAYVPTVTTTHPGPQSRSIFLIKKVEQSDIFGSDEIIRYGQKVRIEVNPYLHRKTLYLSSTPLSPTVYSPVSSKQEASLTTKNVPINSTWVIDYLDPNFRFEKQGSPVEVNDPILIRHLGTNHYLASDFNKLKNDFGQEYEVFVNSFASKNRS
jgi:hypothetical protein